MQHERHNDVRLISLLQVVKACQPANKVKLVRSRQLSCTSGNRQNAEREADQKTRKSSCPGRMSFYRLIFGWWCSLYQYEVCIWNLGKVVEESGICTSDAEPDT